jgi:TonB family protein
MILILAAMLMMNDTGGNDISVRVQRPVPAPQLPPPRPLTPCEAAERSGGASPEMIAWKAATDGNRLEDFRAFLKRYPKSACAAPARTTVTERRQAAAAFAAERADGPAPAMIAGDPAFGISSDDYPIAAMRNAEEGTAAIAYEIAPDGRVEACQVTQSSGSAALDEATCRISTSRGRYRPARDARGKPIRSHGTRRIRWQIPRN